MTSHYLFKLTLVLILCAAAAGCEPSASKKRAGSVNNNTNPSWPRPSIRTQLLKRLQDQSREQQQETLLAIVLGDEPNKLQHDALEYLSIMGPEASSLSLPLAEQLLVETNPSMVRKLQSTLLEIQADIEDFLLAATETANEQQIFRIVQTLGLLSASKPASLEFLTKRLSVPGRRDQQAACESLEKIGPLAHSALPRLIEIAAKPRTPLQGSPDSGHAYRESRALHLAAISAIAAIGANEEAIPVLTSALSGDPLSAQIAANALAGLGPRAASALPELEKLKAQNDYQGKAIAIAMAVKAAKQAIAAIKPTDH